MRASDQIDTKPLKRVGGLIIGAGGAAFEIVMEICARRRVVVNIRIKRRKIMEKFRGGDKGSKEVVKSGRLFKKVQDLRRREKH